eukprot:m.122089 g.122089  ORF g.122089 m.122089 type:complete len:195 (-) comp14592_c2_seq1:40-624(-)
MHRDLKSGNLLISSALRVKVADFGTATIAGLAARGGPAVLLDADESSRHEVTPAGNMRAQTMRTKGVGTPLWMAPEIIAGRRYGPSADVYSYAIVMWELAAQAVPWAEAEFGSLGWVNELHAQVRRGIRPDIDETWPAAYVRLMTWCWATDGASRPRFAEIVSLLRDAQAGPAAANGRAAGAAGGGDVSLVEIK